MRVLGGGARRELAVETLLLIAFAAWGLAIAIALLSLWEGPAPAGQLPGLATKENFDARAPFRFVLGLIILPIALPFVLRPLARRLPAGRSAVFQPALPVVASIAMSLWYVAIARDPLWVIVPPLIVLAGQTLLSVRPPKDRQECLSYTRFDWILLPATGAVTMALIDLTTLAMHQVVIVALLIVFAVRVAVTFIASPLEPALAFLVTPLALALQTSFFARDQRYFGWHALAIVVVSPFVVRIVLRNRRRALGWLAFAIYPIAVYSYMNATSIQTAEGKPRAGFFEDSHSLMPAGEYLRGERPYRDVLPVHGLVEDGLLDTVGARTRGPTLGEVLSFRVTIGTLNAIAVYALGFALTGIPEGGLAAYFLWQLMSATTTVRVLPALLTLAILVFAVRRNRPRWLVLAALACVVCGLTSLDYALYTTLILLLAAWRMRALRFAAIGLGSGALVLAIAFAALGILDDFVRATFGEVLSLGPAYVLPPFHAPASMSSAPHFPEVLSALLRPDAFPYIAWVVALIATAVMLTRPRRRRVEPLLLVGMWIVLAAVSYGERHHLYFKFVLPSLAIAVTWMLWRRRRPLAWAMIAILLIVAIPTTHAAVVGWMRGSRGPIEQGWVEVHEIPRARGALLLRNEAEELRAVKQYVDLTLKPNETFFDFTNRGIFYYLLDRDCPIRWVETAYYETEERQRAVIEILRTNPNIRAALIPDPPARFSVDGVANAERAPLVWQYLEHNFEPDFAREGVVFWRRRSS